MTQPAAAAQLDRARAAALDHRALRRARDRERAPRRRVPARPRARRRRLRLYLEFDKPLAEAERAGFRELVRRRAGERVPVSQLIGRKEFWSLSLRVTPDVLTPRPETETLVAAALRARAAPRRRAPDPRPRHRLGRDRAGARERAPEGARHRDRPLARRARGGARRMPSARLAGPHALPGGQPLRAGGGRALRPGRVESALRRTRRGAPLRRSSPTSRGRRSSPAEQGLAVLRALAQGVAERLLPGGALALELAPEQADGVAGWCREAGLLDVAQQRDLAAPASARGRPGADAAASEGGSMDRIVVRGGARLSGEVRRLGLEERDARADGGGAARRRRDACSQRPARCATSTPCSSCCARSARAPTGIRDDPHARAHRRAARSSTAARRPTTWCARCAPRSWCSVRWSRASAARASRSRAAARSACGRSTST